MRNKKKIAIGAVALSAVLVAAGTFAWFTTTDKVENIFDMDNFDVVITEDFDPSDVPLVPGTDITKEVGVSNNGNVDVLVRVKLEETLSLLQMETDAEGGTVDKIKVVYETEGNKAETDGYVPAAISDEMIEAYKGQGYSSYTATGVDSGITVLRKTTKNDGENNNGNTVYSYLAYKVVAATEATPAYNHLVKLTPVIGSGSAADPESFKVEYAYNMYKDASSHTAEGVTATATGLTGIHGITTHETEFNEYFGSTFHDVVILNFATPGVQTDGAALAENTTWYLADDGYFYYTKPLTGATISEPLLESVSISKTVGNAFKGATYTITPIMEAVQVEHAAVQATWTDLSYNHTADTADAAVSDNNADGIKQMIANIINTEAHKGYYQ